MLGKKSKEKNWTDLGRTCGNFVKMAASDLVKFIIENDESKAQDSLAGPELLSFASALYYTELDRWAFSKLSEKDRNSFSDMILLGIIDGLSELWEKPAEIRPTVINQLNNDLAKLAPYAAQLYPDKDESPKGTLYWEFSKMLSTDYGVDTSTTLVANLAAMDRSTTLWQNLKSILPEMNKH